MLELIGWSVAGSGLHERLSKLMMLCVSFFGILRSSDLGSANVHKGNVGWTQGHFILNYRN